MTTDEIIALIARRHLNIITLETRHSDRLDFHEVSVWEVKTALLDAFRAGQEQGKVVEVPLAKSYWLDFSEARESLTGDPELASDMAECTIGEGYGGVLISTPHDDTPRLPLELEYEIDGDYFIVSGDDTNAQGIGVRYHYTVAKKDAHKVWSIYCVVDPDKQDAFRDAKKRMEAYGVRFLTEKPK